MEKGKLQIVVNELETTLLNCKKKSEAQELVSYFKSLRVRSS